MPDLAALGIDHAAVVRMYEEWQAGAAKSELERRYLANGQSHGKLFTALVKQELGHDTERASPLRAELARLRKENEELRVDNAQLRQQLDESGGGR
jgi:hypothetical protein